MAFVNGGCSMFALAEIWNCVVAIVIQPDAVERKKKEPVHGKIIYIVFYSHSILTQLHNHLYAYKRARKKPEVNCSSVSNELARIARKNPKNKVPHTHTHINLYV